MAVLDKNFPVLGGLESGGGRSTHHPLTAIAILPIPFGRSVNWSLCVDPPFWGGCNPLFREVEPGGHVRGNVLCTCLKAAVHLSGMKGCLLKGGVPHTPF